MVALHVLPDAFGEQTLAGGWHVGKETPRRGAVWPVSIVPAVYTGYAETVSSHVALWKAVWLVAMAGGLARGGEGTKAPALRTITAEGLQAVIAASTSQVVLLHFWATWCPPCREEFPALVRLARKYPAAALQVVLVSADAEKERDKVGEFLGRQGVREASYLARVVNDDFIRSVSSAWTGALPASFFFVRGQGLVAWWEGARTYEAYAQVVERLMRNQARREP